MNHVLLHTSWTLPMQGLPFRIFLETPVQSFSFVWHPLGKVDEDSPFACLVAGVRAAEAWEILKSEAEPQRPARPTNAATRRISVTAKSSNRAHFSILKKVRDPKKVVP